METGLELTGLADLTDTTERLTAAAGYSINNSGSFDWMIVYYFVVIGLLIGGMLFLRKYVMKNAGKFGGVRNGTYMKILDRVIVGQDKQIILIELGNKIILVGASSQRIEALGEYPREALEDLFGEPDDADNTDGDVGKGAGGFGNNFLSLLGKKLNIKDKDK
jgi:flagellar biogenesis protein FliO